MNPMEKKLEAVMRFIAAGNGAEQERARQEVRQMLTCPDAPFVERNVESEIRRILLDIGVPEHIKGHRRLVTAICIAVKDPDALEAMGKTLYPTVAKAHQDTPARVERSIRHAIEVAWDRCDYDVLAGYFGNTVSPMKGKPANSEFIARIASIVRQSE